MMSYFVLLFVSLLTSCEAQGTFGTCVFVLKGRDLLLKLPADPPEGVLSVEWKQNTTVLLVRFGPSGKTTVTGRLELGGESFSVILKNLQEADSGVYSAVAGTLTGDKTVAEYKVTVQDPPRHPVMVTVICILTLILTVVLIVWLYNRRRRIIRLLQRNEANMEEAALTKMTKEDQQELQKLRKLPELQELRKRHKGQLQKELRELRERRERLLQLELQERREQLLQQELEELQKQLELPQE